MTTDRALFRTMHHFREYLLNPEWSDQGYPVESAADEPKIRMDRRAYYESVWWLFHLMDLAKKMAPRVSPEGQVLISF